ncbi:MAG: hypothetical protein R3B96_00585 [Pirellulaceae bacterium]
MHERSLTSIPPVEELARINSGDAAGAIPQLRRLNGFQILNHTLVQRQLAEQLIATERTSGRTRVGRGRVVGATIPTSLGALPRREGTYPERD